MVECAVGDNYCNFSIIFGVFSIVCLIAVITEIIIFNSNKHIIVLFIAQTLCITMSLEYFLDYDSKLLYFIKEYLLLISYTVTSYYFIFQAYYMLIQSKSLQALVYFSLFVSILAFIIITIIFLFNLIVGFYGIPCNNYLWIIMRSLGMMMSCLFMFVGILISKKIKKIRKELNEAELKSRLLFLW